MARKKEYSVEETNTKKRTPQPPSSAQPKNKECVDFKGKPSKRRDQGSAAGPSGRMYDVADLRAQLGSYGLTLRDIPGDGNCLFRALGDQLDGHSMNHLKHRMDTVRYMIAHRAHFEPFIDIPFERYVDNLSRPGTYAGQDALVAFARLHEVNIVIHQLNSPLWQIEGSDVEGAPELHLSYHNGEHYSSVRRFGDIANTPPHIRIVSVLEGATEVPCCASQGSVCRSTSPVTSQISHFGPNPSVYMQSPISSPPKKAPPVPNSSPPKACDQGFLRDDDEFSLMLKEVMVRSGCRDTAIATEALIDYGGAVEPTVDYLLSLSLILEPIKEGEQTESEVHEDDDTISKEVIDELPRRRTSSRRNGDERAERRRSPRTPPNAYINSSSRVVPLIDDRGRDKKVRKQGSVAGNGQEKQKMEVTVERNLRFLTL